MSAEVQRDLAHVLRRWTDRPAAASEDLLPTVQALIADAEKRAAAAALEDYGNWLVRTGRASVAEIVELRTRVAALDPAGAASGETT